VIGWKVEVQFRKDPNRPVLIIRLRDEEENEHYEELEDE
jgi:hypothetical protein